MRTKKHKPLKLKKNRILMPLLAISLIASVGSYLVFSSQAAAPKDKVRYRIATYNILGSGANAAPAFNKKHNTNTEKRAKAAIATIRDFDIVGMQELDFYKEDRFKKNQFEMFKDGLANDYAIYPANSPLSPNRSLNFDRASMRAIVWKKDKFKIIDSGQVAYPYQDAPRKPNGNFENNDKAPWVLLQDKDNPSIKFYVINVHLIAFNTDRCRWDCNPPNERGGSDKAGDQKRKAGAEILRNWAEQHKKRHPVVLTGDFNSGVQIRDKSSPVDRSGLPYCVLTSFRDKTKVIYNTMDLYYKRTGTCPSKARKYQIIDQIYTTQSFSVEKWGKRNNTTIARASDHRPTFVIVTLPLPNKQSQADGSTSPISAGQTSPTQEEVPAEEQPTSEPLQPADPAGGSEEPPTEPGLEYYDPDNEDIIDD